MLRKPGHTKSSSGKTTPTKGTSTKGVRSKASGSPTGAKTPQERLPAILKGLETLYPKVTSALEHVDPFQLLVATILSAQCTDERVNQVTPGLFARYPDAAAMSRADPSELEEIIHSTGFFRNKARSILGSSKRLVETYGGKVPPRMEDLLTLPGVARKTANVVLGTAFGISSGVVVDTHVKRIAGRLGLTGSTDPEKIERDLMALLPTETWIDFSHRVIWHGRGLCKAKSPLCQACPLAPQCPSAQV